MDYQRGDRTLAIRQSDACIDRVQSAEHRWARAVKTLNDCHCDEILGQSIDPLHGDNADRTGNRLGTITGVVKRTGSVMEVENPFDQQATVV